MIFSEIVDVLTTHYIHKQLPGRIRYVTKYWQLGQTRSIVVLSNLSIEEKWSGESNASRRNALRNRFIEIGNAQLLPPNLDDSLALALQEEQENM